MIEISRGQLLLVDERVEQLPKFGEVFPSPPGSSHVALELRRTNGCQHLQTQILEQLIGAVEALPLALVEFFHRFSGGGVRRADDEG